MKRISILLLALTSLSAPLFASETIASVSATVENNNSSLKALRTAIEAKKLENKTGIYLPDPEVEFNYLFGTPGAIGNRTDVSVTQEFDFPTISGRRNSLAKEQNKLADLEYKVERMSIMLQVREICIRLTYINRLTEELTMRLDQANSIVRTEERRLQEGLSTMPELNNVKVAAASTEGQIKSLQAQRAELLSRLKGLNGGIPIDYTATEYEPATLPGDFAQWMSEAEAQSPIMAYVGQEVEVSRSQLALSKSMGLPTFSAGYMLEKTLGQNYQGISVGISVPLWSNRNRVKQADTALLASQLKVEDARLNLYNTLEVLYAKAQGLREAAEIYDKALRESSNSTLLKKSLDEGNITILEYLMQMSLYFDTVDKQLEARRDYYLALAELQAYVMP